MKKNESRLQKTIEYLSKNNNLHISVHDVAGIMSSCNELKLPWKYQINDCVFCNTVKSSSIGHKYCMSFKAMSIAKCIKEKKPYTGRCYLGQRQVVYPIFWRNKLICIIYVGNMMLDKDIENHSELYKTTMKRIGLEKDKFTETFSTVEKITDISVHIEAAYIIANVIINILNEKGTTKLDTKNQIINNILNYCNESYNNDLKLTALAKIYFIHPDYLCKLFKREVGVSFSDYLNQIRIEKAQTLIATTNKKIIDIAFDVGYTSDTYFIRKFKEATGVTPKQYQLKYAKKSKEL